MSDMKTIKEMSEKYLEEEKDEIVCVYDRYAGFVDGANYVLEQIEEVTNICFDEELRKVIAQLKKK